MDFPRKRFIEMVKKYVHFRRVKEIHETVQRMKTDTNISERVLVSLKEIEDRMIQVILKKNSFWFLYRVLIVATWGNIKHEDLNLSLKGVNFVNPIT